MSDIFFSYAKEDAKRVSDLADRLDDAGYSTWCFLRIKVVGNYLLATRNAINECRAFVLVISRDALRSGEITPEVVRAHKGKKPIVPILFDVSYRDVEETQPAWDQVIGAGVALEFTELTLDEQVRLLCESFEAHRVVPQPAIAATPKAPAAPPRSRAAVPSASIGPISPRREQAPPEPPERPIPPDRPRLIRIPAGPAVLGAHEETIRRLVKSYGLRGGQLTQASTPPQHITRLAAFEIGRCAVSNAEYREFVEAVGWRQPTHWTDGPPRNRTFDREPVTHVSFDDAEAYCQWRGVRLPTNDEWERAARGAAGLVYPWGNDWPQQRPEEYCNTLEHHRARGERVQLVPVDSFAAHASPDQILGMVGNVWEWVDGGEKGGRHSRGGSWRRQGDYFGLTWFRLPAEPGIRDDETGFRCANDPGAPRQQVAPADLATLVRIAGGTCRTGVTANEAQELARKLEATHLVEALARHAPRTARVRPFRLRKHLVTNEEYFAFVEATGHRMPGHWVSDLLRFSTRPFLEKLRYHPVVHVNYADAEAFCEWQGVRLPTPDEWEFAARGDSGTLYAGGDHLAPGAANFEESGLGRTSRVDAHPASGGPSGCEDLSGNVQEWVQPDPRGEHRTRGGSFQDRGALYGLAFLGVGTDPSADFAHVGFRFASDD